LIKIIVFKFYYIIFFGFTLLNKITAYDCVKIDPFNYAGYAFFMKWLFDQELLAVSAVQKDEVLLSQCTMIDSVPLLRMWTVDQLAVVLGKSNNVETETNREQCVLDEIPIIRRCSGGGTVLIGPGCLCYSLILPLTFNDTLMTINGANQWIMTQMSEGLSDYFDLKISVQGYTDLCLAGRKFSGNSQRRLKHALLFHGTLLYNFDLSLVSRYLAYPSRTPAYRQNRTHDQFLTQLPTNDVNHLVKALISIWV